MSEILLKPEPLTTDRFVPYGDVIHAAAPAMAAMNEARFERFHDLAKIDVASAGGRPAISIARCRVAVAFPHRIDMLERHPHGSQAFVPLTPFSFVVVVAPAGETADLQALRAFVTDGTQGVNYARGTWHMPMVALEAGQQFLIVDRAPTGDNCDEFVLDEPLTLEAP